MSPILSHLLKLEVVTALVCTATPLVPVSQAQALASPLARPTKTALVVGPSDVAGIRAVAIAAGERHTCALTRQGGVKCWGYNGDGELGTGTTDSSVVPVDVAGLTSGVSGLAAGYRHTCAVLANGGVKCWGLALLGDGYSSYSPTPVAVVGLTGGVVTLVAGWGYSCALTKQGGVKCWGSNNWGQLGDGTTVNRNTPVDVGGLTSGVVAIAAGLGHTCALTQQGEVKCWGLNDVGQLGDGTLTDRKAPVTVLGLQRGVATIFAGGGRTCARMALGDLKCWGGGPLGDGTVNSSSAPIEVSGLGSTVLAVSAGRYHLCVLLVGGEVKCWGVNHSGQLGDGTTNSSNTPVNVSNLQGGVTALAAGTDHTCALTAQGGVQCCM